MCGIVGYVGKRNAQNVLLDGLEKLEYRGYDSAGVALALDGGIRVVKSKGRLAELRKKLELQALAESGCGIGHTRWATHGEPSDVNSHPHSTPRVSIVHNGIIENYGILKERLIAKGYTFESETDTEVLVKLIDSCYEGEPLQAIHEALSMVRGSYALAVLFRDFPDTVFAVKRESPLIVGWGEGENFVASDIPALLKYTRRYSVLEEGDLAVVTREGIRFYNEFAEPVEREILTADWDMEAAEKGGYPHFMLKEIFEQPDCIHDCMRGRINVDADNVVLSAVIDNKERLLSAKRFIIVTCGTSWHAGLIGKHLIESFCRIPVEVEYASEFRYRDPVIDGQDVVIAISQSGETADTLAAVELAKSRGAFIYGICNAIGSSIPRATHTGSYIHVGPEIGVASTKAFTGQVTVLAMLALTLAKAKGTIDEQYFLSIVQELNHIPEKMKEVLELNDTLAELSKTFTYAHNFIYLGRGYSYPVALEGALKLKEISYIHAEGYPAAEMKHGPIALIDAEMPVVVIATQNGLYEKVVSNIQEIKARKGKVIAFVTKGDTVISKIADCSIELPETIECLDPLITTVPLQLLAYHIAVCKGMDVDQPRNLAKSVTVE